MTPTLSHAKWLLFQVYNPVILFTILFDSLYESYSGIIYIICVKYDIVTRMIIRIFVIFKPVFQKVSLTQIRFQIISILFALIYDINKYNIISSNDIMLII